MLNHSTLILGYRPTISMLYRLIIQWEVVIHCNYHLCIFLIIFYVLAIKDSLSVVYQHKWPGLFVFIIPHSVWMDHVALIHSI